MSLFSRVVQLADTFLLWQLIKVWLLIIAGAIIVLTEKFLQLTLVISSYILPVAVIDWFRYRKFPSVPRILRGYRDKEDVPGLRFDAPQLIQSQGYVCETHYVRTRDGFLLCLHRLPRQPVPRKVDTESLSDENNKGSDEVKYVRNHNNNSSSSDDEENTNNTFSKKKKKKKKKRKHSNNSNNTSNNNNNNENNNYGFNKAGEPDHNNRVVFMMHGFLQSSEAFLSADYSLPFKLVNEGYDVWIGNARGNKYSCNHTKYDPHEDKYWDFCLDELAQIDIPAIVDYIIKNTQVPQISYIGFSQGTAVAFAALSLNTDLQSKINQMIALAPATNNRGFKNPLVEALTTASPEIVYLILGKKDLLPSCLRWQRMLSTKVYTKLIDLSCTFLFGWDLANIHEEDKPLHYAHIYSYSSVKTVVQWFQFKKTHSFHMYDNFRWRAYDRHMYVSPCYPLHQIKTPIAIMYGGRDKLPDTARIIDALPKHTAVMEVPSYEHMDFMYSRGAQNHVYPKIIEILNNAR